MNAIFAACRRHARKAILVLAAGLASIGCVSIAKVDSVVAGNHLATASELAGLKVTRGGETLTTAPGMVLKKGDHIVTDGTTEAVILFGDTYALTLGPDTDMSILNPSIFLNFGKAVVEKLRETAEALRDKFRVETEYVRAGVQGTEFAISVDRNHVVELTVLRGAVVLESKTSSWAPQTFEANDAAVVRAQAPPSRGKRLRPQDLDAVFAWARRVETLAFPGQVPAVVGQTLEQARKLLSGAGLHVGSVRRVAGKPEGTVLAQRPEAGRSVHLGSAVDLDVAGTVTVPDLRGMTAVEAGIALSLANLNAGATSEEPSAEAKPGRVLRQSPPAGTRVSPGSTVTFVVAAAQPTGPSETAPPPGTRVNQCTVPDIRNAKVDDARALLKAAGLRLGNISQRIEGPSQQDPAPGTRVACGSAVDFTP